MEQARCQLYLAGTLNLRVFSRLKGQRSLNHITVRGWRQVTAHCYLSTIVLQAYALATGLRNSVRQAVESDELDTSAESVYASLEAYTDWINKYKA